MANLNKVMLIGRLGKDPEKRVTSTGSSVVNLPIATTEFYKDQQGNRQEKSEWHRVILWNKQADLAEQYLKKGSQIYCKTRFVMTLPLLFLLAQFKYKHNMFVLEHCFC